MQPVRVNRDSTVLRLCTGHFVRQYLTNFGLGFGCLFALQRRKRRASRLKSRSVSLTIRQTLASRALDGKVCTFPVADAERNAVGVTEDKILKGSDAGASQRKPAADMPKSTLLSRTVMGTGNATQHIAALVFIQGAVHD
jgi:hypothetical protein